MADIFDIKLPDGRIVGIQANSPEEAAQGARNVLAREQGAKQSKENYAAGVLDSFAKGQSMGLSDELGAAANATFAPVSRAVLNAVGLRQQQPTDNDTWQQRYDQNLAMKRGFTHQFEQGNPKAAMAANIGGNVLTSALALPAGATAAGPSLGGNMLRMGATGGVMGGVQGFNEGEGGFDKRLMSAAIPAALGGIVGAGLPVAGAIGRVAMESGPGRWLSQNVVAPVAQRVAGAFEGTPARSLSAAAPDGTPGVTGPLTEFAQSAADPARAGAIERLAVAAQRSGMSREHFERRLADLGPEAMLADLNQQFMSQARVARTLQGETRDHAENVLTARERGRPDRVVAAFEGDQPPASTFALKGEGQQYDQNLRNVGQKVYGDMAEAGLKQTPELMALYENPAVKGAIDRVMAAEKATRIGTDRAPATPVEIMHKVKQAIWDLGFDKETARPGPMSSWYRDLGIDYMNKLKAANPALAEADRAYSHAASLPERFTQGYKFLSPGTTEAGMNSSAPALAEALAQATPEQIAATRAGMVNVVRDTVQGRGALAKSYGLTKDIETGKEVQRRLAEVLTPERNAEVNRVARAENVFEKTNRDIRGGSQSVDKAADVFDNVGVRATGGGITPRFYETLKAIAERSMAPNEAVRNKIGQIALNPRSDENRRLLAEILAAVEQRRSGRPLASALAGSTGSQFGGP